MTVAYVNSGTIANTSFGTSVTVTMPASLVANRLLICVVQVSATPTITFNGVGWTKFLDLNDSAHSRTIQLWYKVTSGTESTFTVTTSASQSIEAQVSQFSGNLTSGTIIRTLWVENNANAASLTQFFTTPPVRTDGSMYVVMVNKSAVPTAVATGWTQSLNQTTGFQLYSLWTKAFTTADWNSPLWLTYAATWGGVFIGFEICSSSVLNSTLYTTPHPIAKEYPVSGNALGAITLRLPQNRTVGNVLTILAVSTTTATISTPTGYTKIGIIPGQAGSAQVNLFWRIIDGTESDTLSLTGNTGNYYQIYAMEWTNINATLPFGNLQSTQFTGAIAATSATATGFNTSQANSLALNFWAQGATTTNTPGTAPTSGSFKRLQCDSANVINFEEMGAAGSATGSDGESWSASMTYQANMLEAFLVAPARRGRSQAIFVGT